MASVDYQKLHGSEGAMILGHDARWDGREDVKYKNEHINPELTYLNDIVFANESYQNETSKQAYERLKNRVQEIDEIEPPQRIRKDRVTMIGVEIPCPPNVDEEMFFKMAMEEVVRVLCDNDSRNTSNMYVHRDEIHDYVDCVSKQMRTSLTHGHCVVVPHVDGKGVNGKTWATKKRFTQMNKAIDERCRKEFGVPFLTGTREKSKATVEQLKTESIKAAEELEQQKQKELSDIQKEINGNKSDAKMLKEQVNEYIQTLEKQYLQIEDNNKQIKDSNDMAKQCFNRMKDIILDNGCLENLFRIRELLQEKFPTIYDWILKEIELENYDFEQNQNELTDGVFELDSKIAHAEGWDIEDISDEEVYPIDGEYNEYDKDDDEPEL